MAKWSRNKVDSNNINGGNQYEKKDRLSREQLNAMVNSGLYSQDQAEIGSSIGKNQPDTTDANVVGTPSVTILDEGTTSARLKFSNLKGDKGDKGDKGEQGVQGEKGDKGDKGDTALSVSIGSVTNGNTVSVTNSGTDTDIVLDFVLKAGLPVQYLDYEVYNLTRAVPFSYLPQDFDWTSSEKYGGLFVSKSGYVCEDVTGYSDGSEGLQRNFQGLINLNGKNGQDGKDGKGFVFLDYDLSLVVGESTEVPDSYFPPDFDKTVDAGKYWLISKNGVIGEYTGWNPWGDNPVQSKINLNGAKGDKGDTALTLSVGSVTSGEVASVTNVGTDTDLVFDFVLPKGEKGDAGVRFEYDETTKTLNIITE